MYASSRISSSNVSKIISGGSSSSTMRQLGTSRLISMSPRFSMICISSSSNSRSSQSRVTYCFEVVMVANLGAFLAAFSLGTANCSESLLFLAPSSSTSTSNCPPTSILGTTSTTCCFSSICSCGISSACSTGGLDTSGLSGGRSSTISNLISFNAFSAG
uniref:Uncharacterized protein n=1 Tax=Lutzomyia longipalpis TaxID=7200 RepID=A0A7G3B3J4_LUTLO